MKILLIYHFFHPDTVISARLFSELAEALAAKGMEITVFTSNRMIRSPKILASVEDWHGICIRRFACLGSLPNNTCCRLLNSVILMLQWVGALAQHRKEFDAVIVGTDPQFSYWMFPFFRLLNHKIKLIHWVFDLYPEAGASSPSKLLKMTVPLLKPLSWFAYHFVDFMIDIGPCMRARLQRYCHRTRCETMTPWALVEPEQAPQADPVIRQQLFGNAKIGLLYSGTVGYAHDITPFIRLARECRNQGIDAAFCFAGYGNCYKEQTALISPQDTNIRIADFVSQEELEKRLAAADIYLVSLRPGLEGTIVPSKFFGALAIGRAILFSGSEKSEIAQWCRQYQVGFMLNQNTAAELQKLIDSPEPLAGLQKNALETYQHHFSKELICNQWIALLQQIKCGK